MRVLDEIEIKAIVEGTREQILDAATKKCDCTPFNTPCIWHKIAYNVIDGMEDVMVSWNETVKEGITVQEDNSICTVGMSEDQFKTNYPDVTYCK